MNTIPYTGTYTDDELLKIAKFVLTPADIDKYIEVDYSSPVLAFTLDGEEHTLDLEHYTLDGFDERMSPQFMTCIVKEYDKDLSITQAYIDSITKPMCDDTILMSEQYLKTVFAIMEYLETVDINHTFLLDPITVDHVERTLTYLDDYGSHLIKKTIRGSVTPRRLTYQLSNRRMIDIKLNLINGFEISDINLPGVILHCDNWRDQQAAGQFAISVYVDQLNTSSDAWYDDDLELPIVRFYVASHIFNLCTTITTGLSECMVHQNKINTRGKYDAFVYDANDIDSLVANAIATYRLHHERQYKYDLFEVKQDINFGKYEDKSVCFSGVNHENLTWLNHAHHIRVINMPTSDTESAVIHAWNYFIGKPQPFFIRLFTGERGDYLPERLTTAIMRLDESDRLRTVTSLIQAVIQNTQSNFNAFPELATQLVDSVTDELTGHVHDTRIAKH